MALEVHEHPKGEERRLTSGLFVASERLWLTADGEVVEDGHPDAAHLYATPGSEIPIAEAREKGLVKEPKQRKPAADKQRKPGEDK